MKDIAPKDIALPYPGPFTAFAGARLIASGPLADVALAIRDAAAHGDTAALLAFEDATGKVVDLDLRGPAADIATRYAPPAADPAAPDDTAAGPRGRGRPKLGVVAREVTLLPRQWEWLSAQAGGASVALRRLVDQARRDGAARHQAQMAQEAAYRFMSAMAGDFAGFEEASRALFAKDLARFEAQIAHWPADIGGYAAHLAFGPGRSAAEEAGQ